MPALLLGFDSIVLSARRENFLNRQAGAIFCLHGLGDLLLAGNAIVRLAGHLRMQGLQTVLFVHPAHLKFARRNFDVDEVEGIDRHRFTRKFSYRAAVLIICGGAVCHRHTADVQPYAPRGRLPRARDWRPRKNRQRRPRTLYQSAGTMARRPFLHEAHFTAARAHA